MINPHPTRDQDSLLMDVLDIGLDKDKKILGIVETENFLIINT